MAELKLDLSFPNLGDLKRQLETIVIGGKGSAKQKQQTDEKSSKSLAAVAAFGGIVAGLMGGLVSSSQSIQNILKVIGGMIDQILGPFVPILINLMKPLFAVLLGLAGLMIKFFKDPVGALKGLGDFFKSALTGTSPENSRLAAQGAGAVTGGGIGAYATGGSVTGTVIGATIGAVITDSAYEFGDWLGEQFRTLMDVIGVDWDDTSSNLKDSFKAMGRSVKSLFNGDFQDAFDELKLSANLMVRFLGDFFDAGIDNAKKGLNYIGDWFSKLSAFVGSKLQNMLVSLETLVVDFINFFIDFFNSVLDGLDNLLKWVSGLISDTTNGLISPDLGISGRLDRLSTSNVTNLYDITITGEFSNPTDRESILNELQERLERIGAYQ